MHRVLAWIQSLATVEYTVLDNVRVVFLLSKCFLLVFFLAKIVIHVCYAQHTNSVLYSRREKKKNMSASVGSVSNFKYVKQTFVSSLQTSPSFFSLACRVNTKCFILSCWCFSVMAWTFVIRLWRLLFLLVFNLGSTEANTNIRTRGKWSDFTVFT